MGFVNGQPADPGPEQAPFFMHFGHFMWQFANVERMFHWSFHTQCGLTEEVARAIVGGEQLSKITKLLNSVMKARRDQKAIDELQNIIDQTNVIAQLRHDLIHRGAETKNDGTFDVSNATIAKSRESTEIIRLNLQHLKNATADLECIALRLIGLVNPTAINALPQSWKEILAAPWRYKRVEPDKPFQPLHKVHP